MINFLNSMLRCHALFCVCAKLNLQDKGKPHEHIYDSGSFTATLIQPAGAYIESAEAEEIGDAYSRADSAFRGTVRASARLSFADIAI